MNRRDMKDQTISTAETRAAAAPIPVAFVLHGSPMAAIETGPYQEALARFGREHRPKAVVAISAHWDSAGAVRITSAAKHRLVYDFGGFPRPLYELTYESLGRLDWQHRDVAAK